MNELAAILGVGDAGLSVLCLVGTCGSGNYHGATPANLAFFFSNFRVDLATILRFSGNSGVACDLGGFF